jgi:hypothetical protein
LREIEINRHNLEVLIDNLREEDKLELIYYFKTKYKEKIINTILNIKNDTYFLAYNSIPSCIGGAYKDAKGAQVWLLCSENYNKKFLYKYVKAKLNYLKTKYNYLYNYIFESNFSSLKLLKRLGFNICSTTNSKINYFYLKGGKP